MKIKYKEFWKVLESFDIYADIDDCDGAPCARIIHNANYYYAILNDDADDYEVFEATMYALTQMFRHYTYEEMNK